MNGVRFRDRYKISGFSSDRISIIQPKLERKSSNDDHADAQANQEQTQRNFAIHEQKLRAQIRPAQFFAHRHIGQGFRAEHIFDLVGFDGTGGGRAQHVDHLAGEGFTGFDVTGGAQAATLDDGSLDFILGNEFIG